MKYTEKIRAIAFGTSNSNGARELLYECANQIEQRDKVIYKMAVFIGKQLETCPLDLFDYDKIDCENLCSTFGRDITKDYAFKCWVDYFNDNI